MGKLVNSHLTRIARDYSHPGNTTKHLYYKFLCACGQEVVKRGDTATTSCNRPGCKYSKKIKHGQSNTRIYTIWEGIITRTNPSNTHHSVKHYGSRGITVCDDWRKFTVFKDWADASGYKDTLTIDRINIDGDYTPSNCEWVTRAENTRRQWRDGHGTNKNKGV